MRFTLCVIAFDGRNPDKAATAIKLATASPVLRKGTPRHRAPAFVRELRDRCQTTEICAATTIVMFVVASSLKKICRKLSAN
jgi:hypothetical protein